MTRAVACSQAAAEARRPTAREVCISITEPGAPCAVLHGFLDVLRLSFADRPSVESGRDLSPQDAERIAAFARRWWDEVETVVVHCHQGVSRSVAVMLALNYILGHQWAWPTWFRPERRDAVRRFQATGVVTPDAFNYAVYRRVHDALVLGPDGRPRPGTLDARATSVAMPSAIPESA